MLRKVLDLFSQSNESEQERVSVQLATAALLSEIMRADREISEEELSTYENRLTTHFSLSEEALSALVKEGQETAHDAVDMVQFTQAINQQCSNEKKQAILKSLWEVAYADNNIAPIEEHTIRRIADLLHIPHSQFIKTKLAVTGT